MDNFMDKLAQKFNASEFIKANTQAETMEMQKMKEQIMHYDEYLEEMRKLNLKNAESAEQIRSAAKESLSQISEREAQSVESIEKLITRLETENSEMKSQLEKLSEQMEGDKSGLETGLKEMEEFVHKENVKVYRNVQASIVEELKSQTEALNIQIDELKPGTKGIKGLLITTLILSGILGAANLAFLICDHLGVLPF